MRMMHAAGARSCRGAHGIHAIWHTPFFTHACPQTGQLGPRPPLSACYALSDCQDMVRSHHFFRGGAAALRAPQCASHTVVGPLVRTRMANQSTPCCEAGATACTRDVAPSFSITLVT